MLSLLPKEPVARVHALRKRRPFLEPAVEGGAQLRIGGVALGERDVGEGAVEPGEQLAQRAQALQLARPEDAVALRRALRLDQARALYVAQHSRRPTGRLSGLVDGEPLHRDAKVNTIVSRLPRRGGSAALQSCCLNVSIAPTGVGSTLASTARYTLTMSPSSTSDSTRSRRLSPRASSRMAGAPVRSTSAAISSMRR